jgi:hypothetical protein
MIEESHPEPDHKPPVGSKILGPQSNRFWESHRSSDGAVVLPEELIESVASAQNIPARIRPI